MRRARARDLFLQVEGNKVSDVVRMKTGDHVELEVALSYRVSFTTKNGEPERWFHVKNYVGLLCDHLASLVRSAARTTSIDAFHSTRVELLRTAILGEKEADRPRLGRTFEENGMWVYDVEILDVRILDADVKKLLADAQKTAIVAEIQRRKEEMRLTSERLRESVDRAVLESQIATLAKQGEHEVERSRLAAARADAGIQLDKIDKLGKAKNDADAFEIASAARLVAKEKEAMLEERARVHGADVRDRAGARRHVEEARQPGDGGRAVEARVTAGHPRGRERGRCRGAARRIAARRRAWRARG